jgi:hypothetical protein
VWEILNFEYFFGHLKIQLKFEFWVLFWSFKNSTKIWNLSTFLSLKIQLNYSLKKMVLKGKISWATKSHFRLMGQAPLVCVMLWWITVAVVVLLVGLAFKGLGLWHSLGHQRAPGLMVFSRALSMYIK